MKKKYVKPQIIIENFSLSTTIAGGCEVRVDTQASGNCGVDFGGTMIFMTGYAGCLDFEVEPDDGQFNGLCYHVPMEDKNLFNS